MTQKIDEEEIRRLSVEIRFLEETAEAIQSRIRMLNAAISDLTYASMTLEGLEKEGENAELLVPIGGNSYIKARLQSADKVTVGIGAGISIEKTIQEAKEIVRKRIEELEKSREELQRQFSQVIARIQEDQDRLQKIAATLTQEKNK
ncbi:MAG: prefoldin subunit alpha [Candidatus Bathyarchaeia archaeon]|nr:prefoldin subunit alpha [Candidatus Bathyarchaeota archaeon]